MDVWFSSKETANPQYCLRQDYTNTNYFHYIERERGCFHLTKGKLYFSFYFILEYSCLTMLC